MKTISKFLISAVCLISVTSCARGNGLKPLPNSLLNKMAYEEDASVDIKAHLSQFDGITDDTQFLFPGSPFVLKEGNVVNLKNGTIVAGGISYGNRLTNGLYFCSSTSSGFIFDNRGVTLMTTSAGERASISNSASFVYGGHHYYRYRFSISYYYTSDYLYLIDEDGGFKVISEGEYNLAYEASVNGTSLISSSLISLKELGVNSNNKIIGDSDGTVRVYSKSNNYIGSIPVGSWEMGPNSDTIVGKNGKIFFFDYDVVPLNKGLATKINSYCFEVDLNNATWEYRDNLPYIVDDVHFYYEKGLVAGSLATVTPLTKNHEKKLPYKEIYKVTNSVTSYTKYAYDSIVDYEFIKAGKKTIAYDGSNMLFLSGNKRVVVEGLSSIEYADSKNILYETTFGKKGIAAVSDFESVIKNQSYENYDYVSWKYYNGTRVKLKIDGDNYILQDGRKVSPNFWSYAIDCGIVIDENTAFVIGDSLVLKFGSNIVNFSLVASLSDDEDLYRITCSGGDYYYLSYKVN